MPAASPARWWRAPSGAPRSANKMGIIGMSDPSGHYEVVLYAEGSRNIAICSSQALLSKSTELEIFWTTSEKI